MTNSADPDHLASSEASWSWSTLLARTEQIWFQQDKGLDFIEHSQKNINYSVMLRKHEKQENMAFCF